MKKKKKIILWAVITLIVASFFALPSIINTNKSFQVLLNNVTLSGVPDEYSNYIDTHFSCENDKCSRSSCIKPEDLPEEIINYKICVCCINFDYKSSDIGKSWVIKDYKYKIFYKENGLEKEKTYSNSDSSVKIVIPNTENQYLNFKPGYSQPYYMNEKYPEKITFNFFIIRINYRALLEYIISKAG